MTAAGPPSGATSGNAATPMLIVTLIERSRSGTSRVAMASRMRSASRTASVFPVTATTTQIILAGRSKSGACFYVFDDEAAGITKFATANGAGNCAANGILPPPTEPSWKATW